MKNNLNQNSRTQCQESKPGTPEYEAGRSARERRRRTFIYLFICLKDLSDVPTRFRMLYPEQSTKYAVTLQRQKKNTQRWKLCLALRLANDNK